MQRPKPVRTTTRITARIAAAAAVTTAAALIAGPVTGANAAPAPRCQGKKATIVGTMKNDHIRGTRGRDVIVGLRGWDRIDGRGGNDVICGGNGRDRLIGGRGNDKLYGQADAFQVDPDIGEYYLGDRLNGGPGSDRIVGGDRGGKDLVSYRNARHGVTVSLPHHTASGQGADALIGVLLVDGSDHADAITVKASGGTVYGNDGDDTLRAVGDSRDRMARLFGMGGDDRLVGSKGRDRLDSGSGTDTIRARSGEDKIDSDDGDDRVHAGAGDDDITNDDGDASIWAGRGNDWMASGPGDDILRGGRGTDVLSYRRTGAVTVDLRDDHAEGEQAGTDRIPATENVVGSRSSDTLLGDGGPNTITPLRGPDVIKTFGGDDRVDLLSGSPGGAAGSPYLIKTYGGEDRVDLDRVYAQVETGAGDDAVWLDDLPRKHESLFDAGDGRDRFSIRGAYIGVRDNVVINLAAGAITTDGGRRGSLAGIEDVNSGSEPSHIVGNDSPNKIWAGDGRDVIEGRGGDDDLNGGRGRDRGDGGDGTDTCKAFETVTACEQ